MTSTDAQTQRTESPHGQSTAVFLGTGTSVGVPAIGCECAVCQSDDTRNKRLRCALLVYLPGGTLLIDTPPDLRTQLLREKVRLVHAVLYTHEHADHLFGLDDLRLFPFRLGHAMPLYCTTLVEQRIRHSFDYAFSTREQTHPGSRPQLEFETIDENPFQVLGATVTPIPMKHGPHFNVFGFRIGDFAYCTDTNFIPDSSIELLQGVRTFVVGALRHTTHPTHYSVSEAVEVSKRVGAEQVLLTHVCHDLDHQTTNDELPSGIDLAFDGLRVEFNAG
ncbi:MBL fold metallo-hydrolase [Planctomycetes bacterium K23_9]|uniref:Phosphoribosyl 1,2-cyclic phosphodiesterase n=1 Tax=Stieleria marina TaxID=1930275 RepID=A0A517NZB4_9BACT|nr:Phosphoribosyl 1,2-cyclic phosphodiesterase [Planctomycetes bacterium K23_9]